MEEKNNRKYAGQVVDIPRSNLRLSFNDRLKKMSEEEGDPYLNIFSKRSIYLISLFNYEKKRSLVANLPLRDMPLLKKRTDCAEQVIFQETNQQRSPLAAPLRETGNRTVTAAFTPLKMGKLSGRTPGDLLLEAEASGNVSEMRMVLERQIDFLKGKLNAYPQNQSQIDAIEEAISYYDLGCLRDHKPDGNSGETGGTLQTGSRTLTIYHSPIKHQKEKNKAGKNACYSVKIFCSPAKKYPYHLEIMNCYAPLKQGNGKLLPVIAEEAEDMKEDSIDLTEGEWLYVMGCLDENMQNTKNMWYAELRRQDERNRWKGNNC